MHHLLADTDGAIARQTQAWHGVELDPEKQVTVCCGSTEAMISTRPF